MSGVSTPTDLELLAMAGQVIAWQCFGDCRAISDAPVPASSFVLDAIKTRLAALSHPAVPLRLEAPSPEIAAWRDRFSEYVYRPQDDCIALRHETELLRLEACPDQWDVMRVALEVIAVGDSNTPRDTAAHALIAAGFWRADADLSVFCRAASQEACDAAASVPKGWKLVPEEATDAMIDAAGLYEPTGSVRAAWRDMLAAAPSPAPTENPAASDCAVTEMPNDTDVTYHAVTRHDEVLIAVKRLKDTKDYDYVHQDLVAEDFLKVRGDGFEWRIVEPSPAPAPHVSQASLGERLQQKCVDIGAYWRASDAHGVNLTHEQALDLLRDALGVEVDIDTSSSAPEIAFRLRIARLLAELHGEETLSEQQCARYMGIDLVSWRRLQRCFSAGTSFVEGEVEDFPAEDSESILRAALSSTPGAQPSNHQPSNPGQSSESGAQP